MERISFRILIKYEDFLPVALKHMILDTVTYLVSQKRGLESRYTDLQPLITVN